MEKTIMYVHGFGSSGKSSSAVGLAEVLTELRVVAPDLPMDPQNALEILNDTCHKEGVTLVVGTSMGGMLAQALDGVMKIIVNPAFHVSEKLVGNFGEYDYLNPRQDGVQKFTIDQQMCDRFAEFEATQFDRITPEKVENTYAFFGDKDPVVNCKDEYLQYYNNYEMFEGEHRIPHDLIVDKIAPLIRKLLED